MIDFEDSDSLSNMRKNNANNKLCCGKCSSCEAHTYIEDEPLKAHETDPGLNLSTLLKDWLSNLSFYYAH